MNRTTDDDYDREPKHAKREDTQHVSSDVAPELFDGSRE